MGLELTLQGVEGKSQEPRDIPILLLLEDFVSVVPSGLYSGTNPSAENFDYLFTTVLPNLHSQESSKLKLLYYLVKYVSSDEYRGIEPRLGNFDLLFSSRKKIRMESARHMGGKKPHLSNLRLAAALSSEYIDALMSGMKIEAIANRLGLGEGWIIGLISELNGLRRRREITYNQAREHILNIIDDPKVTIDNLDIFLSDRKNRVAFSQKIAHGMRKEKHIIRTLPKALQPDIFKHFFAQTSVEGSAECIGWCLTYTNDMVSGLHAAGILSQSETPEEFKGRVLRETYPDRNISPAAYNSLFGKRELISTIVDSIPFSMDTFQKGYLRNALKLDNFSVLTDYAYSKDEKFKILGLSKNKFKQLLLVLSLTDILPLQTEPSGADLNHKIYSSLSGPKRVCGIMREQQISSCPAYKHLGQLIDAGLVTSSKGTRKNGVDFARIEGTAEKKLLDFLAGQERPTLVNAQRYIPFSFLGIHDMLTQIIDEAFIKKYSTEGRLYGPAEIMESLGVPAERYREFQMHLSSKGLAPSAYPCLVDYVIEDLVNGKTLFENQICKRWGISSEEFTCTLLNHRAGTNTKTSLIVPQDRRIFNMKKSNTEHLLDLSNEKIGRFTEKLEIGSDFLHSFCSYFGLDTYRGEQLIQHCFPYIPKQNSITANYNASHKTSLTFSGIVTEILSGSTINLSVDSNNKNRNIFRVIAELNKYAGKPLTFDEGLSVYRRLEGDVRFDVLEQQMTQARLDGRLEFECEGFSQFVYFLNNGRREELVELFGLKKSPLLWMLTDPASKAYAK